MIFAIAVLALLAQPADAGKPARPKRSSDQVYVFEMSCPAGTCSRAAPARGEGVYISDALSVEFEACVFDGRFTGVGAFETWIENPKGERSPLVQAQYVVAGSTCKTWSFTVSGSQATSNWRASVRPNGIGVTPGGRLKITYTKKVAAQPRKAPPAKKGEEI